MLEWLFSWEVTSVASVALAGFAFAVLGLDDFKAAKLLFLLAAADAAGGIVMWGIKTNTVSSLVLIFALTGGTGVLTVLSFRYVDSKRERKEKQIDRGEVAGHIEFWLTGGYRNPPNLPERLVAHVGCSIDNGTAAPTGLTGWKALIRFVDGRSVEGIPPPLYGDLTIPLIGYNQKQVFFKAADYLPIKTMQPIPAGGATYGWYYAVFDGVSKEDVRGKGAVLVIEFAEIASGKPHEMIQPLDSAGKAVPGIFKQP